MYAISNEYKSLIETSLSLSPKSKIIVDNVEYDGSVIKTYPKVSHKNSTMIGGFPSKTCSFEIYDLNNNLDFQDKEVTIYRGLDINGATEWIPQGIFIPKSDKITTNISTRTISFNGIQDKSQLFDTKYESSLNWDNNTTHTGLEIVQEICTKLNIVLETTTFNWYNYNFKQPNFTSNTTYREVISRLAEIGGSIAYISRTGGLTIKSQTSTGHSIARKRYSKLTKEKQFGSINVVVLGKKDINDDIVYPQTLPENKIEWKILDNPFVDLYREEMIETVASYIIGQSMTPFTLNDFVDGFYLDMNDTIQVTDKNNNTFNATILNYESTSRIKSSVGADTQSKSITDYNLAGSIKEQLNEVRFNVDHNSQTIDLVASKVSEQQQSITYVEEQIQDLNITVEGLTNTLTKTGGGNLIKDSLGALNDGDWTNQVSTIRDTYTLENSIAGQGIMLNSGTIEQQIQLPNEVHTLSFRYKKNLSTANVKLYLNDVEYVLDQTETTEFVQQVTISNNTLNIKFTSDTDNSCYILDLLLNLGFTKDMWTQNANETVTNTVKIGQGIQVEDSKYNTYWRADSDGTRIVNKVTGDYVQETTDKAVIANELTSRSTSIINGVLFAKVGSHRWISGV